VPPKPLTFLDRSLFVVVWHVVNIRHSEIRVSLSLVARLIHTVRDRWTLTVVAIPVDDPGPITEAKPGGLQHESLAPSRTCGSG